MFYTGNVYLLTGVKTFSSAGSFSSAFQCFDMGVIVGEETGVLTVSYGDVYSFTLPHTGLQGGVSHKKLFRPAAEKTAMVLSPTIL